MKCRVSSIAVSSNLTMCCNVHSILYQIPVNSEFRTCPIGRLEERIEKLEDKIANYELQNGWDRK